MSRPNKTIGMKTNCRVKIEVGYFLSPSIFIQAWFVNRNPFTAGKELVSLESGLVDHDNRLNCDEAEKVGAAIHKEMDGKSYTDFHAKKSKQITNLLSLYSNVNIDKDKVTVDPLTLFLRLIVLVERKPEKEIAEYFDYELAPYPMALFKDGLMRTATKSALKPFLQKDISSVEPKTGPKTVRIVDGGALLWCCDWKKNETFDTIFERYASFLKQLKIDTIVFDGYDMSTKDSTHQKRAGSISQDIDIKGDNPCPANRKDFLGNYQNKKHFVEHLAAHLRSTFKVIECPSDADTSIVKEALIIAKNSIVTVFSDDTDVLCLLAHHAFKDPSLKDIYLGDMTKRKGRKREFYKISDITTNNEKICQ